MAKQQTMKAKVLDFVESKGEARYTDIIRFIVDHNYGEGTWDNGYEMEPDYKFIAGKMIKVGEVRRNVHRGVYSGAFRKPYTARNGKTYYPGYFFNDTGYGKLVKQENGLYKTVR